MAPKRKKRFPAHGDAWCTLRAGYNIELDRREMLVDIWDRDGKHYDELGREYPFVFRREWRSAWPAESNGAAPEQQMNPQPPAAQYELACKYFYGDGVPKSDEETSKWLKKSAGQGLALAQYNLGLMYSNGVGVEQDYEKAMMWYAKAAEQGLPAAQGAVEALGHAMKYKLKR